MKRNCLKSSSKRWSFVRCAKTSVFYLSLALIYDTIVFLHNFSYLSNPIILVSFEEKKGQHLAFVLFILFLYFIIS